MTLDTVLFIRSYLAHRLLSPSQRRRADAVASNTCGTCYQRAVVPGKRRCDECAAAVSARMIAKRKPARGRPRRDGARPQRDTANYLPCCQSHGQHRGGCEEAL